jgi:hypothetical protein
MNSDFPGTSPKKRTEVLISRLRGYGLTGRGWHLGAVIIAVGLIYSIHLRRDLDATEAYTALAAGQASLGAAIRTVLRFDPGKPPLYQLLIHALVARFGQGEALLRAPSVIFSMVTAGLIFKLGEEMFEPAVGFGAAVLWAFSPPALIVGAWARMYAMLISLSLGQFLIMWRLREKSTIPRIAACGIIGAMMLYTHLGATLFLGAEAAILAGSAWRGERARSPWVALFISVLLFLPFAPTALSQLYGLINGHWVDWIGPAHQISVARKATALLTAGIFCIALAVAPRFEADSREPVRWCAAVGLIPIAALAAGSIAIRPMFAARYVLPSLALMVLLFCRGLAVIGAATLRRSATALATALVCLIPFYSWYQPWSDIARLISSGSAIQPVFFEPNFTDPGAHPEEGFPQGFLRAVFERYFHGKNPRLLIDPSSAAAARKEIANAARAAGGAWLISGLTSERAREELPDRCFIVENKISSSSARLYHVVPLTNCPQQAGRLRQRQTTGG